MRWRFERLICSFTTLLLACALLSSLLSVAHARALWCARQLCCHTLTALPVPLFHIDITSSSLLRQRVCARLCPEHRTGIVAVPTARLRILLCQNTAATAAALASGGITAAIARTTTAIETAVAAKTTVTGITAAGIERDNRMINASMLGAASVQLLRSGVQSSMHPMHSAVTTTRTSRGATVMNDMARVLMSGTWQAAAISLGPSQACQLMVMQQDLPMGPQSWMPWYPVSHLAPPQPQQMAGIHRAGLDQVGEPSPSMSMHRMTGQHWRMYRPTRLPACQVRHLTCTGAQRQGRRSSSSSSSRLVQQHPTHSQGRSSQCASTHTACTHAPLRRLTT